MTTANEIAEKIAAENDLTKAQAKTIVDSVFKAIADAAVSGAETSLPGFGKFKVKDSPAREGRNPSTGATIAIAASRKLTFTPAKAIRTVSTEEGTLTTVHRKMQDEGAYAPSSAASASLRWRMSSASSTSSALRSVGVNTHSRSSARNSSMVSTVMIVSPVEGKRAPPCG
jgi:DNA-binding protein HU-beta